MEDTEQNIVQQKVRRAVAASALRKIGTIVAEEQQTDLGKARLLRWFARYGWVVLPGAALLIAYFISLI